MGAIVGLLIGAALSSVVMWGWVKHPEKIEVIHEWVHRGHEAYSATQKWVTDPDSVPGGASMRHLDGIPYWDAKTPRRWHRCKPQTRGFFDGALVERCACGGISSASSSIWHERNTKRRHPRGKSSNRPAVKV